MGYIHILNDKILLYYDKNKNLMVDDDGFEVYNIYKYISPNMLRLFKEYKEDMSLRGPNGRQVILLYPKNGCYDIFN